MLLRVNFLPGSVLVVGVLAAVKHTQSFGFLDERLSVGVVKQLPAASQLLADLRVVHVGLDLGDLPALDLYLNHT